MLIPCIHHSQKYPAAWMNLGIVQGALGKFKVRMFNTWECATCCAALTQEAEESYKKAIEQRKKYPDAYYNLGNLVCGSCVLRLAIIIGTCSVQRLGPNQGGNICIWICHNPAKGPHQCLEQLWLALWGVEWVHHFRSASSRLWTYSVVGMYDKAEEVMRKAIREVPNFAQFYSSLGIMLGRQNRLEVK